MSINMAELGYDYLWFILGLEGKVGFWVGGEVWDTGNAHVCEIFLFGIGELCVTRVRMYEIVQIYSKLKESLVDKLTNSTYYEQNEFFTKPSSKIILAKQRMSPGQETTLVIHKV